MNKKEFWQTILSDLQVSVSPPIFQTLFSQTELQSIEKNIATIACPNPYIQKMIEGRYYSLLKETIDRRTKKDNSLLFIIAKPKKKERLKDAGPLFDTKIQNPKRRFLIKRLVSILAILLPPSLSAILIISPTPLPKRLSKLQERLITLSLFGEEWA